MTFRTAFAVLAGSLTLALAAPVSAQTPADFAKFSEACLGAQMFLIGTEMDYEEEKLKSGFVFRNPNEKGRCGCGESFRV